MPNFAALILSSGDGLTPIYVVGCSNSYSTMSLGLRNRIRSRITKHGGKREEDKTVGNVKDEQVSMFDSLAKTLFIL